MIPETRQHARLSPSAASRWMICPGSVNLCASVVNKGSRAASQGTACHAVLERCLKDGVSPAGFVGKTVQVTEDGATSDVEITAEMAGWVREVLDWVVDYRQQHPGTYLHSETRAMVGRAFGVPDDLWGTVDIALVNTRELVIVDAKFGYNSVSADGNPQLILYAIGLAQEYGWIHDHYRLVILQPRDDDGRPKVATLTRADLEEYVKRYAPKIAATQDPEAPLVPSDEGCHWCDAAGVCPKLQERALAMAQREFIDPALLPIPKLAELLEHADVVRAALDAAEAHALKLIQLGQHVPGWKVVAGDKHRVWTDEQGAVALMKKLGYKPDDYEPRKLVTPAKAEKLVGRATAAKLKPFIEKPKGDPKLVRDADNRPALGPEFTPTYDDLID